MRQIFQPEWRTSNLFKRRFYAKYMTWIERVGYFVVLCVVVAFIFAFKYPVDDLISASDVKLTPASKPVQATQPTLVVKVLAKDFDAVREGQPVAEVVEGDGPIQAYIHWEKLDAVRADAGMTPELQSLLAKYPKPATRSLAAPASGTFRYDSKETLFKPGAEICRVVDYADIRLIASLAGDTVPKAQVGQVAKITSLNLGPGTGTLFRGTAEGMDILSNQLLGGQVRQVIKDGLKGSSIRLRDDVPLAISDVTAVEVDAIVKRDDASSLVHEVPLDPPSNFELQAQVVSGTATASAQLVDLPAEVRQKAEAAIKSAVGARPIHIPHGKDVVLSNPQNVHILVKLKASKEAPASAPVLPATMLKRTYEAELKLQNPPEFLIEALKNADREQKDITAKVDLRTGTRPIAFILLKKS